MWVEQQRPHSLASPFVGLFHKGQPFEGARWQLPLLMLPTQSQAYHLLHMKYCIAALLIAITLSQNTVVLNSDPSTTTIINPVGLIVGNEGYHNANQPDGLGTGAKWIWNNLADGWPEGYQNTFQSLFTADCPQTPALLRVTADNIFEAFLNGFSVLKGSKWENYYPANINLKCGENNLTIVVTNLHPGTPAAVIFAITQDQSKCYNCPSQLTAYNSTTCSCECTNGNAQSCNCPSLNPNWVWLGSPVCGCGCPKKPSCNYLQEFNPLNCSCQCKRRFCPLGFVLDSNSCQCVRKNPCSVTGACLGRNTWNANFCTCQCPNIANCNKDSEWSDATCGCLPRNSFMFALKAKWSDEVLKNNGVVEINISKEGGGGILLPPLPPIPGLPKI